MIASTLKAGDHVLVPWGLGSVRATVLSLFGPPDNQIARLAVELPGDDDVPVVEAVSLRVDMLQQLDKA